MNNQDDILAGFSIQEETQKDTTENPSDDFIIHEIVEEPISLNMGEVIVENDINTPSLIVEEEKQNIGIIKSIIRKIIFIVKYLSTSAAIFIVLLLLSNYSAYWNIASSFIYAEELEQSKNSLIQSVAASSISEEKNKKEDESEVNTFKQLTKKDTNTPSYTTSIHSVSQFIAKTNQKNIDLGIEITPYENRIIIPKIGKNIPLIDIKQKKVEGVKELNTIFMDELENGVIRYPGSAKPGKEGNSFIFGHSSNFPWMEGDYNDVFALLDKVVFDDEIIVYYGQEKYTYKIRTKDIIRPGDVSILKSDESDKSKLTLMTCWPIGTTLNRLVLTADLINIK